MGGGVKVEGTGKSLSKGIAAELKTILAAATKRMAEREAHDIVDSRSGFDMTVPMGILFAILIVLAYIAAPVMLFWGWVRWTIHRPRTWTVPSTLSFAGFVCASASALLALCVICYGASGGFQNNPGMSTYSPDYRLFYRCIAIGAALSALGMIVGIGGVWRKNQLRWHAPVSAIATLAFWVLATTWP